MTEPPATANTTEPVAPDPPALEALAITLAEGAAEVVRLRRGPAFVLDARTVDAKSTATDLVTEVDLATEQWLVEQIALLRPGDGVLGEEGGAHGTEAPMTEPTAVRWVLDPIDGTVNFVLGIPHYAVSVAAEVDGVVVAGAVCNPVTGETFHARAGGGAFLRKPGSDPKRLPGPRDVALGRAVINTGFGYDARRRARQIAVVAPLLPLVGDIRRLGAASLDLCFVASGRVDGYFEAGLNPWDHAAGGLVATESGCVLGGLHGRPPSGQLVVAAGAGLAPELFALLESLGADTVY